MKNEFEKRLQLLEEAHHQLINKPNEIAGLGNGVFDRYKNPVLTAAHAPLFWKYDLNPVTNPYLMERFGINAAFNAGAIKFNGKYIMVVRVHRPLGADQHHQLLAARDARIEQIALQHHEMLRMQRQHHGGIFAALRFVDRHRIGQRQLIEFVEVVVTPAGHQNRRSDSPRPCRSRRTRPMSPLKTSLS